MIDFEVLCVKVKYLDTCIIHCFLEKLFKSNYLDSFMRVIAGQAKGTRLTEFKDSPVRPTLDQVKETLFNILRYNLSGEYFLDLFGGSGAIGIEALSRGAEKVIWVENNRQSQKLIYANLEKCRFWNGGNESSYTKWKLLKMDALQAVSVLEKSCLTFDVVYVDPPFAKNLYNEYLNVLSGSQLLKASTLVVVEHNKKNSLEKVYGKLSLVDQRMVGGTTLSFYRLK